MRKRERENPCQVCQHYHKFEEGERCNVCGHMLCTEKSPQSQSAFSTEILPGFLFLGTYDNASRCELMRTQGITHILNTVPSCQNLYRNSFTYHNVDDWSLPFEKCNAILDECHRAQARVLVHCMAGHTRSPAIVIAYLMWHNEWSLAQSIQFVKDRKPNINVNEAATLQRLQDYEQELLRRRSNAASAPKFPVCAPPPPPAVPFFGTSGDALGGAAAEIKASFVFGAVEPSS